MNFKIPPTFVQPRLHLTWREVEFGFQKGWLSPEAAIDLAVDRVAAGQDSADVVELASVLPHETYKVPPIVRRLAERDPDCSEQKWLFLLLAWLYEHRQTVEEPLAVVEQLYADFDYPPEMAEFVRYMPARDPSRVGEPYLFEAWRHYLDAAGRSYGHGATGATEGIDGPIESPTAGS